MVHAALDAGVTLIDTADAYARDEAEFGHNEELVAAALRSYGGDASTCWSRPRAGTPGRGTRLGARRVAGATCAGRARRRCGGCGVEAIGLYQFHRPDPATPWEESMGALRSLSTTGWCGWSASRTPTSRRSTLARAIVGDALVSVQNQFSPGYRSSADELAHCAAVGLALAAVEPVRRGVGGRLARRDGARVRRGGRGARRLGVPGDAGLAPGPGRRRRPDPRGVPAGVDPRLRGRRRPRRSPPTNWPA